jgi:hypothetical protein
VWQAPPAVNIPSCSIAADGYVADLLKAEEAGDWTRTIELLTEVRVLNLELPHETVEAGIRTLVDGARRAGSCAGIRQLRPACAQTLSPAHGPALRLRAEPHPLPAGKQHQRAVELSVTMLQKGWSPSDSTMGPLFSAVASSQPADKCITMLKV